MVMGRHWSPRLAAMGEMLMGDVETFLFSTDRRVHLMKAGCISRVAGAVPSRAKAGACEARARILDRISQKPESQHRGKVLLQKGRFQPLIQLDRQLS